MNKNNGFILLVMLIFMQLYSLLGLTAMENALRAEKLNAHNSIRRQMRNEARLILRHFQFAWSEALPHCLFSLMPIDQLRKKPLAFWVSKACAGSMASYQYYYIVEKLGHDACADYYRLSLLVTVAEQEQMKMLLQSLYTQSCSGKNGILSTIEV